MTWTNFAALRKWIDRKGPQTGPLSEAEARPVDKRLLSPVLLGIYLWLIRSPLVRSFARGVTWLLELGTSGYPPDVKIRLKIMNAIAYLTAATTAGYAVQHLFLDFERFRLLILLNASVGVIVLFVPLCHRISDIAAGLLIVVVEWIALALFMMLLGRPSGVHLQYFVGAAAPFLVFGLKRLGLVFITVVSGIVLHIWTWFAFKRHDAIIDAGHELLNSIYIQAAVTTGALIAAVVWYAFSLAEQAREETDTLLRNVLPGTIAERLKRNPDEAIAEDHSDATVMFADISGFVALARQLGPARVVDLLNDIVRQFDELAERHGVEKIKTIGDAYMAVAGVPEPAPDHGQRIARMAIDMLRVVSTTREATGLDLHVRIGMASGPLMAGVIGTKKFSYDVWGDTVNLASRLEGASERGAILICPGCYEKLTSEFECEPKGTIDIKGVGPQQTWFLRGARAAAE